MTEHNSKKTQDNPVVFYIKGADPVLINFVRCVYCTSAYKTSRFARFQFWYSYCETRTFVVFKKTP